MITTCTLIGGPLDGEQIKATLDARSHVFQDPPSEPPYDATPPSEWRIIMDHLVRVGRYDRDPLNTMQFLWAGWLKPIGGETDNPPQGECLDLAHFPMLIMDE